MDKRAYAIINNQECHIGDFVVVYPGSGITQLFERIYRVAGVKFDADGARINCVIDGRFSGTTTVNATEVASVLLESEVRLAADGRFQRAD